MKSYPSLSKCLQSMSPFSASKLLVCGFLFCGLSLFAQEKESLKKERDKISADINLTNKLLKETRQNRNKMEGELGENHFPTRPGPRKAHLLHPRAHPSRGYVNRDGRGCPSYIPPRGVCAGTSGFWNSLPWVLLRMHHARSALRRPQGESPELSSSPSKLPEPRAATTQNEALMHFGRLAQCS